jgi:hypothetical protein
LRGPAWATIAAATIATAAIQILLISFASVR